MNTFIFSLVEKGAIIKYATNKWWGVGGSSKMRIAAYRGEGVSCLVFKYASIFMFLAAFLSYSALFYLYIYTYIYIFFFSIYNLHMNVKNHNHQILYL